MAKKIFLFLIKLVISLPLVATFIIAIFILVARDGSEEKPLYFFLTEVALILIAMLSKNLLDLTWGGKKVWVQWWE